MPRLEQDFLHADPTGGSWSLAWYGARMSESKGHGLSWSHALEPGKVHLVFNLAGQAVVIGQSTRLGIAPSTVALCYPKGEIIATRLPDGSNHEFVVVSLDYQWLERQLGPHGRGLHPFLSVVLGDDDTRAKGQPVGQVRSMTLSEKDMARQLSDPPVDELAQSFWYAAKVSEIIALHMFRQRGASAGEPFCTGRKRVARERVDKVIEWLDDHMEEPLDLKLLAQHVGCAPHYLSRVFSSEMGRTISQQLRAVRIDRAAGLLETGRYNVTEAAVHVGYSSLSHFTKAFVQEKGMKPSEFLAREAV